MEKVDKFKLGASQKKMLEVAMLIIAVVNLLRAGIAFAAGEQHLPGEIKLVVGLQGKEQAFKKLVYADSLDLNTRVIYSTAGLVPPGAKRIVILIPGTSGSQTSEYGFLNSQSHWANLLVNEGAAPIGFMPPVYYKYDSPSERAPFLAKYSTLEGNLEWFLNILHFVYDRAPKDASGIPLIPIDFDVRSFGAGIAMEAYHRAAKGDPRFAILKYVNSMLLKGVDGQKPKDISAWSAAERKYFIDEHPELGDKPVVEAGPKIYQSMTWQIEENAHVESGNIVAGMELGFTIGAVDEFGLPLERLAPILDFLAGHPGIPSKIYFHAGKHDPGSSSGSFKRFELLRLIIGDFIQRNAVAAARPHIVYIPDRPTVENTIRSAFIYQPACINLNAATTLNNPILFPKS